jgi:hypothetical protein
VGPPAHTDAVAPRDLVELMTRWAVGPLDLLAGAVTYDRLPPHPSPYERWYGLNHRKTAARAREYLRGYYWANLLTAGQLARLGGRAALEAGAADHEIRPDAEPWCHRGAGS